MHDRFARWGANVDAKVDAEFDVTPIHLAAIEGCPDCVAALLMHRANIKLKDKCGDTPFMVAKTTEIKALLVEGALAWKG